MSGTVMSAFEAAYIQELQRHHKEMEKAAYDANRAAEARNRTWASFVSSFGNKNFR